VPTIRQVLVVRLTEPIAVVLVAQVDRAADGACVRVEQELRRIEAVSRPRLVRAVDAEAIELPGVDAGDVRGPGLGGALDDRDAMRFATAVGGVEQAELDGRRVRAVDRDVHSGAIAGCAERIGAAGARLARSRDAVPEGRGHIIILPNGGDLAETAGFGVRG